MVDLFALNDLVLLELLENKVLFSSDILDEFDTSKGSLTQDSKNFVLIEFYFFWSFELECLLDRYLSIHLKL